VSSGVEIASDAESEGGSGAVSASMECSNLDSEGSNDRLIAAEGGTVRDDHATPQRHSTSASSSATRLPSGQSGGVESDSEPTEEKASPERRRRHGVRTAASHSAGVSPKRQKLHLEGTSNDADDEDCASREQMSL